MPDMYVEESIEKVVVSKMTWGDAKPVQRLIEAMACGGFYRAPDKPTSQLFVGIFMLYRATSAAAMQTLRGPDSDILLRSR